MASRGVDSDAISGGRSPSGNQAASAGPGQNAGGTSHQTISTQVTNYPPSLL